MTTLKVTHKDYDKKHSRVQFGYLIKFWFLDLFHRLRKIEFYGLVKDSIEDARSIYDVIMTEYLRNFIKLENIGQVRDIDEEQSLNDNIYLWYN